MVRVSADRATEYARAVVDGSVTACDAHRKACARHLRDLDRQGTEAFPFYWDEEKARRILDYAETLTILEGTSPRPVRLYGFQAFDISVPFGWYKPDGNRRFRRKYKSVSRQNGKTFENGIVLSYICGFDRYHFGNIYTVATRHAQAKLAWKEVHKFILADPALAELFDVKEYESRIISRQTGCSIEALSRERAQLDGFRSIAASVDELHQHKDNGIYKAIYNGTRSLPEVLISMITTRGFRQNSFCGEMDKYALDILDGSVTAEDFFADVYTLDKGDVWTDEKVWVKSNPLLASTPAGLETLRRDAQTAQDMGGEELRDFLVKGLNCWPYNDDQLYIPAAWWNSCLSEDVTPDRFAGCPCFVGVDLSSGGDLCSVSLEFPQGEDRYVFSHSFMPRGRYEEHCLEDLAPYDVWAAEGLLTVTGGRTDYKNDYGFIVSYLADLRERYGFIFQGIGYDPHNADGFLAQLEQFGCPLVQVTQSARNLSAATEDFRLALKSGHIHADKRNALLTWSMVNARTVKNSFGEMKIDKEPNAKKKRIDPVDALIDAHYLSMKPPAAAPVDVNAEMERYLKGLMR